jgi:hypothetical protein
MEEIRKRFSDIDWANKVKDLNILIVGAGGIGSWTTLLLSRAGFNSITVIDDDTVELVNLGGQFYSLEDVGTPKVFALNESTKLYSDYELKCFIDRFEFNEFIMKPNIIMQSYDIIISAFDNMDGRKQLFSAWKNIGKKESVFIDGRLLAEVFQILTIEKSNESNIKKYEDEYLFNDSDVEEVACTSKATSYYGAGIAFEINKKIISWIRNTYLEGVDDLPFEIKNYSFLC